MTAIARSTPNFALPATQNTAPVHEYRCLYTHDIRKKAKKWHDGSARFHTFNKRVMVYDDTKNYIGDLHYRADEDFGEGVELQLDRGVLVEVGEQVGETQTDVTGIRNVPHATSGITSVTSSAIQPRTVQRVNHVGTQGRPKSLVELLGTPQGRHGRANLPLTSPFEQRQSTREVHHAEPSAKRQKTSLGKENAHPVLQHRKQSVYPSASSLTSRNLISSPITSSVSTARHVSSQLDCGQHTVVSNIIDISSEEDVQVRPKPVSKKAVKPKPIGKSAPQGKEIQSTTSASKKRNNRGKESSAESIAISVPSRRAPQALAKPVSTTAVSSSGPGSSLKPGMSQLRMQTQKPRRKLMYKTLLPSASIVQGMSRPCPPAQESQAVSHEHVVQTLPSSPVFEVDDYDQDPEFDDFEQLISHAERSPSPRDIHCTPPRPIAIPIVAQPSPLFVSQTVSQRSPSPPRIFVEDHFDIPATQRGQTAQTPLVQHDVGSDIMQVDDANNDDEPESPSFPQPPPPNPLTQAPLTMMAPPRMPSVLPASPLAAKTVISSPTKTRSLSRSLSENDTPISAPPNISLQDQCLNPPTNLPITMISPLPPIHAANRSPTKSPIQRSRSETDAIMPTTVGPDPMITLSSINEEGPWTKLEAFLLFDKWPMCKQKDKPVFETNDQESIGDMDVPIEPPKRLRIRTARSFMMNG